MTIMIWMTIIVVARWLVNWTCLSRATKNMQYVYIYVHMYTYVYVCLRMIMNLYMCTRVYEGIHVHMYAHMHTYMRTCVYICTHSSADVWIRAAFGIIKIRWACSRCVVACVWICCGWGRQPPNMQPTDAGWDVLFTWSAIYHQHVQYVCIVSATLEECFRSVSTVQHLLTM